MIRKKYLPILLILLLAFALRTYQLTEIPPGLTHDEANHGRDAINVLDGVFLFYFPLNYGSEPLYNYIVAGNMALLGENLFALRLVNVMFGLLTVAATYLWANWAFRRQTALVGAALIAVSFWPLATSRQALRAGLLPLLMTAAIIFFWIIYRQGQIRNGETAKHRFEGDGRRWWSVVGFAIFLAATLHTYLAARALWLIFPIFLLYLAIFHRRRFKTIWLPVLVGLLATGLLIVPMFAYIQAHPEADTRLQMLDGSLQNITSGNFTPVLTNATEAIMALFWPDAGDSFLAYNIPGRPLLGAVTALLFIFGLAVCFWRWRRPAYAFIIIWLGVGILPSLVTGPTANTTRNIGALPAVYLIPAIGFVAMAHWLINGWQRPARIAVAIGLAAWLFMVGLSTTVDYFYNWGQDPDVRAAYQQTLIRALDHITTRTSENPLVISSLYPGPAHDPSIAKVLAEPGLENARWVDARYAIIFPQGQASQLIIPSSTPLHPAFSELAEELERVNLKSNDLDPFYSIYRLQPPVWDWQGESANFGNALTLLGSHWLTQPVRPGEAATLLTLWEITNPGQVGPTVPPAFETDAVLFSHVLNSDGEIIAQHDALDAPSWDWQKGDQFIQIHTLSIPQDTKPGEYQALTGLYDRTSGQRLPVYNDTGQTSDTFTFVVPLVVDEG